MRTHTTIRKKLGLRRRQTNPNVLRPYTSATAESMLRAGQTG